MANTFATVHARERVDIEPIRAIYRFHGSESSLPVIRGAEGELKDLLEQADRAVIERLGNYSHVGSGAVFGLPPLDEVYELLGKALKLAKTPEEMREVQLRLMFTHEMSADIGLEAAARSPHDFVGKRSGMVGSARRDNSQAIRIAQELGENQEAERIHMTELRRTEQYWG